mgnify:CR=1 FL=1|tara:strand:- start:3171 stop:3332 length:162 start_codon:yes stop_codon:yes gene_type:complete
MDWIYTNPKESGKYIVQTKSTILGTIHALSSNFNADKETWSFKNQIFYRYLKE